MSIDQKYTVGGVISGIVLGCIPSCYLSTLHTLVMADSGSRSTEEVKATGETVVDEVLGLDADPKADDESDKAEDSAEDLIIECVEEEEEDNNDIEILPGDTAEPMQVNDDDCIPDDPKGKRVNSVELEDKAAEVELTSNPENENEVFETEKDDESTDEAEESSCFKIDKVYSVTTEQYDTDTSETNEKIKLVTTKEQSDKQPLDDVGKDKKKETEDDSKKSEKQIKPKAAHPPITMLPAMTAGVTNVRMLSGGGVTGVKGANMPLLVSMGAGNAGIPLLPAGLPPGRYVILPGTPTASTAGKPSVSSASLASTVTSASGNTNTPRLATSVAPSPTQSLVAAQKVLTPTLATPPHVAPTLATTAPVNPGGGKLYGRERGRRKSYTTGEKLAMIEAVEGGQRKSTVADRFGVAPSTLACILAQKHKIRAEQVMTKTARFFIK